MNMVNNWVKKLKGQYFKMGEALLCNIMGCLTVKVNSIREREIKIDKKFIGVYVNIVIQDYFFPFLLFSSPFTG